MRRLLLILLAAATALGAGEPAIVFPPPAEARDAIVDDRLEPYFSVLQPLEMAAKTGAPLTAGTLDEQREECRRRYRAGIDEFTAEEQELLRWCVGRVVPLIADDYPLVARTPWRFLKLAPTIEGGLPHTRGDCIVFSGTLLAPLLALKATAEHQTLLHLGKLLLHEQLHVVQRRHPALFVDLYTRVWGFHRAPPIAETPWLVEHHLANPDGVVCDWIFPIEEGGTTRWIWPLVIFGEVDGIARMPADFVMAAIPLTRDGERFAVAVPAADGRPAYTNLLHERAYAARFAGSTNIYHPNEAAADLFANLVVIDRLFDRAQMPAERLARLEQALAPLRAWFTANLR